MLRLSPDANQLAPSSAELRRNDSAKRSVGCRLLLMTLAGQIQLVVCIRALVTLVRDPLRLSAGGACDSL